MKEIVATDKAPKAIGPYSQAVRAGGFLFLSGQIPLVPGTGELVEGDIRAQTGQVMANIGAVLAEAGLGFGEIIKTTIFLTDLGNFATVNEVYGGYFAANPPARSTVEVKGLPRGAMVEIEVVAAV
ncbi:RidA family protein [Geobacter sp.]|uniref:RidA family protein n=1 Tax=Geobacter sp. TaxID=46610 RepID=UPI002622919F|nr:RidA family protein [Geobacter sp.]